MDLKTLASYKSWADNLLYSAIAEISDNELKLARAMLFGNIHSLLHHVYAMDIVWKSNLEKVPHKFQTRNPQATLSFNDLRKSQSEINSWYESYFANLSSEKYSQQVNFSYIGGGAGVLSRAQIMQHVVNHSSYHRGHIEGVLYQMNIEPPTTDVTVYLQTSEPSKKSLVN